MLFSHGFSHAFFTAYNSGDGTLINLYLTDCSKQKKHCQIKVDFSVEEWYSNEKQFPWGSSRRVSSGASQHTDRIPVWLALGIVGK